MTVSSVFTRVARINPMIVLPAVGATAWFAAGLVPGNGTTPAQAMPEPGAARPGPAASIGALPDRLPDSISSLSAPVAPAAPLASAPVNGGSLGATGSPAGGGDSPAGGGQPKHGAQAGQTGATQAEHAHRLAHGPAALHPHPGQSIAPTVSPRPRVAPRLAYVAQAAPPRVMAPAPSLFPFFGGGHFIPRATFGSGHFNGGGGRHR